MNSLRFILTKILTTGPQSSLRKETRRSLKATCLDSKLKKVLTAVQAQDRSFGLRIIGTVPVFLRPTSRDKKAHVVGSTAHPRAHRLTRDTGPSLRIEPELTALKPFYCKKVRREFEIRPLLGMFQPAGESGPPPADIFLVWAWTDCIKRLSGIRREIVEQSLLSEQICIDAAFRDVSRACTERLRRWHATSHCSLLVEQIGYSIVASFCS